MTITAGAITVNSAQSNTATLTATAATGAVGPVTQQWYRALTTGFSPGGGNILSGQTALTLSDSGLIPLTPYFYKIVYTDVGASNATATATQATLTTTASQLSMNLVAIPQLVGTLDQNYNYNTHSVMIDFSSPTTVYAGSAVKIVNSAGGVPKVIPCTANTDEVFGWVIFNFKDINYAAGSFCEISQTGNYQWMYSTGAIARGSRVTLDVSSPGSVAQLVGSSGANVVGRAYDEATAYGQLIRVAVEVTSTFA